MTLTKDKTTVRDRSTEIWINLRRPENLALWRQFLEAIACNGVDLVRYLTDNWKAYLEANNRPKIAQTDFLTITELKSAMAVEFEGRDDILKKLASKQLVRLWRDSKALRLRSDYFPLKCGKHTRYFYSKTRMIAFLKDRYPEKMPETEELDWREEEKRYAEEQWRKNMAEKIEPPEVSTNLEDYL